MNNGWLLLHRKISKKAWFSNPNYVALWVHLLVKASWKDTQLMMNGSLVTLKRGQLLTGRKALSTTSGISENIVRSILNQFEINQQITIQKTNRYSIITVLNYDMYQGDNQPNTNQSPTEHQPATSQPPHIKEVKQLKEVKEKSNGRFTPPSFDEVSEYCKQRNNGVNPGSFIDFYESKGWMVGKNKMKDWKACVRTWEQRDNGNGKDSQKVNRIKKDQFV